MNATPLSLRRSAEVLQNLRTMLDSPQYPAGTKLAPERELATQLNTSRRILREALNTLQSEGLLERAPGRGTIVLETKPKMHRASEAIQHTSPLELMDARYVLEPAIAAAAAIHANSYDLAHIQNYFNQTLKSNTHSEWEEGDGLFHKSLGEATHNPLLQHFYQVITQARVQTEWGNLRKKTFTDQRQQLYIEQHQNIINAIKNRSPEQAAQAMRIHLQSVRRHLLGKVITPDL